MSNLDIPQLEAYLFSDGLLPNVGKLIPGTETYLYIHTLKAILSKDNSQASNLIKDYRSQYPYSPNLERLQLHLSLIEYDLSSNTEDSKREILRKILNLLMGTDILAEVEADCEKNKKHATKLKNNSDLSNLDQNLLDIKELINSAHRDVSSLNKLKPEAHHLIKLSQTSIEVLLELAKGAISYDFSENEIKRLDDELMKNENSKIPRKEECIKLLINDFTLSQLEYWRSINKDLENREFFTQNYILKKFHSQIEFEYRLSRKSQEEIHSSDLKLRLAHLNDIWDYVKDLPKSYFYTQKNLLLEILKTSFVIQSPDLNKFDLFISNYYNEPSNCFENFIYCQSTHITGLSEEKIIDYYLYLIFKDSKDSSKYKDIFEKTVLDNLFAKAKLYYDPDSSKNKLYSSILGANETELLKEKSLFKIISSSNDPKDTPKYNILYKNISEATVNIYFVDLQTFFMKNHKAFDPMLSFNGIFPSKSRTIQLENKDPFKIQTKEIEINELDQMTGVFVVEIISKSLSVRNFIKRGQLYYIHRQTAAGNMVMIFNTELQLFKKAAVYYENKKYDSNQNGNIFFPFAKNTVGPIDILLEAENQYEIVSISQSKEEYSLKCEFYCNEHSLVPGQELKILIAPDLFINNNSSPISLLKAVKISASFSNQSGVSSSLEEKNYFLTENYFDWKVVVPPKMERLDLKLSAQVWSNMEDKWIPLTVSKTYEIVNIKERNNKIGLSELELQHDAKGYFLQLIGKNGEFHPNIDVDIRLKHKLILTPIQTVLRTDGQGKIFLGQLKDIESIEACEIEKLQTIALRTKSWNLKKDLREHVDEVAAMEDETLVFYYCNDSLKNYRLLEGANFSKHIIKVHNECLYKSEDGSLVIKGLSEGIYFLIGTSNQEIAKITIIKGKKSKEFGFMLSDTKQKIYENPFKSQSLVRILDIENENNLKISLDLWDSATRVHIIGTPYHMSREAHEDLRQLIANSTLSKAFERKMKNNQNKQNFWISNGHLDENEQYILSRRKKNRVLGNIFDKPSQLLNPVQSSNKDVLKFEEKQNNSMSRASESVSQIFLIEEREHFLYESSSKFSGYHQTTKLFNIHLREFIKYPTVVYHNLKPDSEGMVTLTSSEFNLKNFSGCWVVACGKGSYNAQYVNFNNTEIPMNNLSLQNLMNPDKYYKEILQDEPVPKGQKFKIMDVSNSELQFIDSVEKLYKCQTELLNSFQKENLANDYNKWDFLWKWGTLNDEQKQGYFDKFTSHELNLFLYHKDKRFFDQVVLPFLQSKVEITLVDKFLLGKNLSSYSEAKTLDELNLLEVTLIMKSLIKNGNLDEAKSIFEKFKMLGTKLEKFASNQEEKIFEIILNMRSSLIPEPEKKWIPESPKSQILFNSLTSSPNLMAMPQSRKNFSFNIGLNCQASDLMAEQSEMVMDVKVLKSKGAMRKKKMMKRDKAGGEEKEEVYEKKMQLDIEEEDHSDGDLDNVIPKSRAIELNKHELVLARLSSAFGNYLEEEDIMQNKIEMEVYQEIEKTKEYAEMHYYEVSSINNKNLAPLNFFWLEYMEYLVSDKKTPFLTVNFKYALETKTELISVLSLIDLPFSQGLHRYLKEDVGFSVEAGDNMIAYHKEIAEAEKEENKDDIIILQRFFEANDRFTVSDNNKRMEKYITKFYAKRVYGCQIVVTNFTDNQIDCQILYQIPQGCLPLRKEFLQKSEKIKVDPKTSQNIEYFFYSPIVQESKQLPLYLLIDKKPVLKIDAQKFLFNDLATLETDPFAEINESSLELCSKEELIEIFKKVLFKPDFFAPKRFVLQFVKSRCFDANLFKEIIKICYENLIYFDDLWRQGLYHREELVIFEWFENLISSNSAVKNKLPNNISTKIICTSDDQEIFSYFIKNFSSQNIVHIVENHKSDTRLDVANQHYRKFLSYLAEKNKLQAQDKALLAMFLIDQGRINEAKTIAFQINPKDIAKTGKIHYDYLMVYLDMIFGYPDFKTAIEICDRYKEYAVFKWRKTFLEVRVAIENKNKKLKTSLKKSTTIPYLSARTEGFSLVINYNKARTVSIRYYVIDMEVLFSMNPFIKSARNDFGIVKPSFSEEIKLDKSTEIITCNINSKYINTTCLIEVVDPTTQTSCSVYHVNCSMTVNVYENIGNIDVFDPKTGSPVPMAYVKAFAKLKNDTVEFYKDGYTDISGRFDYASISVDKLKSVQKYAIMISHEKFGVKTCEADPPLNL